MEKKTIAVIFGGKSSEHAISKLSVSTILSNISKEKYTIIPIYITKSGKWKLYEGSVDNICNENFEEYSADAILSPDESHKGILRIVGEKIKFIPIDVIFPVLHGKFVEDGCIQGLFELANIPYVGCNVISSAVCMDKAYTKKIVESLGINQAKYKILKNTDINEKIYEEIEKKIKYPCYIKPANSGSSKGISKATSKDELIEGINQALKYDNKIVIEENINGQEVECAVLGNENAKTSDVGEVLSATSFYDFEAKYINSDSKTVIPANLDEKIRKEIMKTSLKIFDALECSGLSRVDFFVENGSKKVIFNEINTLPGFTSISMYPALWANKGIKIDVLIDTLISLAIENFNKKQKIQNLTE